MGKQYLSESAGHKPDGNEHTSAWLDERSCAEPAGYQIRYLFFKVAADNGVNPYIAREQTVLAYHERFGGIVFYCDSAVDCTAVRKLIALGAELNGKYLLRLK